MHVGMHIHVLISDFWFVTSASFCVPLSWYMHQHAPRNQLFISPPLLD